MKTTIEILKKVEELEVFLKDVCIEFREEYTIEKDNGSLIDLSISDKLNELKRFIKGGK